MPLLSHKVVAELNKWTRIAQLSANLLEPYHPKSKYLNPAKPKR